ncbi:MAG TPA: glycosyltransferase family 2 protein [Candidatus Polarisedimenticolia bacterium]|nr:glycosyltransferase family 2 protein [Candidatus Polarisedimenticolia bacterium]
MKPAASIIVSTFNRPESLDLVLTGFRRQSEPDFEILIADDGSGDPTAAVVRDHQQRSGMRIRHLWQEDRGFRKTRILNRAVIEAQADYLIFCDGDCLPHRHYVRGHMRNREAGRFLFGQAVFLGPETTGALRRRQVEEGLFDSGLFGPRIPGSRDEASRIYNGIYLGTGLVSRVVHRCFHHQGRRARGRNLSMFRDDLIAVNGWNQDYERAGREDDDLVIRLYRYGLRGKSVRFAAVVFHLYHTPHTAEGFATNDAILQEVVRSGAVACRNGIREGAGLQPADRLTPRGESR